jgi:hypothetical protein
MAYAVKQIGAVYFIRTFAGTGSAGNSGNAGLATSANTEYPIGVWGDSANNYIYFASISNCFRKVHLATGIISQAAGTCGAGACSVLDENGKSYMPLRKVQ